MPLRANTGLSPTTKMTPNPNPVGAPRSPRPAVYPKNSLLSPCSYGLGATTGFPLGGDSSMPRSENPSRQYSWVAESLANDLEFIKARFHIGRFITVAVDTKDDHVNIEALYTDLESASAQINVSIS
jgi:hypothetical protein